MTPLERKRREDLGLLDGDDLELGVALDQSGASAPAIEPLPMGKADPRGPFGSKALGPDYGPFTGNVYFYWFEYMKAYPAYRDSVGMPSSVQPRQAIRDFDVQSGEDFPSWWDRKGEDLFYDLYEDESHAIEVSPTANKSDLGDGLLVYLPIDGSISDMLNEVEHMFKRKRHKFQGKYPELFRKYALHQGRYTVSTLHNKLEMYKAVMAHAEALQAKKIRLHQIFFEIADRLIISRGFRNVSPDDASRKMGEGYELACRLLYHVGEGRFPDYSLPPRRYNPRDESA